MKKLTFKDIQEDKDLSKEEKKVLEKIIKDPYSNFAILKKESENEYFETRSWTEADVEKELISYDIFPVKSIAIELFNKEINKHLEEGYKVHELIPELFEDIFSYIDKYIKVKAFVKSKSTKDKLNLSILIKESTLEIDIIQAAKEGFILKYFEYRGMEFKPYDLEVRIF